MNQLQQIHPIEARRRKLMAARQEAVTRRDWNAMNEITKRLAKLPVKTSNGGYTELSNKS